MQTVNRQISEKEAATIAGVSVYFLRRRRVYGGGPAFRKLGGRVVYPEDVFRDWINSHELRTTTCKVAA